MTNEERKAYWGAIIDTSPRKGLAEYAASIPDEYQRYVDQNIVTARTIPTRAGETSIRIIESKNRKRPSGVIVRFYGGGFAMPATESDLWYCHRLAAELETMVVDVTYHLTGEVCFPIPVYEAYDTAKWVSDHAGELAIDPKKIIAAGESSGGNLSGALTLLNNQEKGFDLAGTVIVYGAGDMSIDPADRPAAAATVGGKLQMPISRQRLFTMLYAETPEITKEPLCSLPLAPVEMLEGLGPHIIVSCGRDIYRNDGKVYGSHLLMAGVDVSYHNYEDSMHGFVVDRTGDYQLAIAQIEKDIRSCWDMADSRESRE